MGTTPPITTNNPQNTRPTKPDQATEVAARSASLAGARVGETFFALLTQKRLIWGVLRTLGDFSLAHAINQLRWASFVSLERCTAAVQQRSHRRGGQRTLGGPRTHKFRMQFPQRKNQCTPRNRRISTIRLQDLKYSPGNCMRNCKAPSDWRAPEGPDAAPVDGSGTWPGFETTRRAADQRPGAAGEEGAGGSGGHGRASRSTTPSKARVWRSRGRPGPTAPGTPAAPQAPCKKLELLVVLRVLVGLAAVGAAERTDRSHLLRRQ